MTIVIPLHQSRRGGTIILIAAFLGAFGIELTTHAVGNEALLLKLGALADNGELHSQYWRLVTYSFLHFTRIAFFFFWPLQGKDKVILTTQCGEP